MLMRQAARIADNRVVAGVHYPADSIAGAALGLTIAEVMIAAAGGGDAVHAFTLDGTGIGTAELTVGQIVDPATGARKDGTLFGGAMNVTSPANLGIAPSEVLTWLWTEARAARHVS